MVGGGTMSVLHAHDAALDAHDAIGGIAELEDVAGEALDGKILIDRANDMVLRLKQHLKVRIVWDRAAGGDRSEPRPARPRSRPLISSRWIRRSAPTAARGEAVAEHAQHGGKGLTCKLSIRPGTSHQRK